MLARSFRQAVVAVAVLLGSVPAFSAILYGTIGAGGGGSTFVQIDPNSGAVIATIGPVGYAVNGMTWDPSTHTLYATTSNNDGAFPDGLITIDPATGAGTPVGAGAGQLVNVPAASRSGELYGWTEDTDQPVLWDKAAGTVTVLGGGGNSAEQTLAFNFNTLYLLNCDGCIGTGNRLFTVNLSSGVLTDLGPVSGIVSGVAHHGSFNPDNHLLYAISETSNGNNPRDFYVIDPVSLAVVRTIPAPDDVHTLAFVSTLAVPVDNPVALIALAILLAVSGQWFLRRRRA
jgi:hypothetical protein